eukprot:4550272-Amphidinium_carterae.1
MDRADTAATHTSGDVGLATSLTLVKDLGSPFRAVGNRSSELNSWPLRGLWKNASPAGSSVTAKVW